MITRNYFSSLEYVVYVYVSLINKVIRNKPQYIPFFFKLMNLWFKKKTFFIWFSKNTSKCFPNFICPKTLLVFNNSIWICNPKRCRLVASVAAVPDWLHTHIYPLSVCMCVCIDTAAAVGLLGGHLGTGLFALQCIIEDRYVHIIKMIINHTFIELFSLICPLQTLLDINGTKGSRKHWGVFRSLFKAVHDGYTLHLCIIKNSIFTLLLYDYNCYYNIILNIWLLCLEMIYYYYCAFDSKDQNWTCESWSGWQSSKFNNQSTFQLLKMPFICRCVQKECVK